MCTFDLEAQMKVFEKERTDEEKIRILQTIGVLDNNGNLTPKYSFIAKYGKKPATL